MSKRDYYEILGVDRDATNDELKKAYRKIAFEHHPDKSSRPESEDIFKEASEAYDILSKPDKRRLYDQYGHDGLQQGGGFSGGYSGFNDIFSNFADIFKDFFGGDDGASSNRPRRGSDIKMELKLSFDEAVWGIKKELKVDRHITCSTCSGVGVMNPEKDMQICSACRGKGQISQSAGFFIMNQTCPYCGGKGKKITNPCKTCSGNGVVKETRNVEVNIPAGVDTGNRLKVSGEGEAGLKGGPNGDLYLFLTVEPHPHFEREDFDLHAILEISYLDAILGTELEIDGIKEGEKLSLKIPSGTQQDTVFEIKGKGVKVVNREMRGDLYFKVKIKIPQKIQKEERELLESLREIHHSKKEDKSWFRKILDAIS